MRANVGAVRMWRRWRRWWRNRLDADADRESNAHTNSDSDANPHANSDSDADAGDIQHDGISALERRDFVKGRSRVGEGSDRTGRQDRNYR